MGRYQGEFQAPGSRDPGAFVALTLMVLVGSSTATAAKIAVRELPLTLMPVLRFGVAGLCLLPLVLRRGHFGRLLEADWKRLLLAAFLCVPVNQAFFLGGTRLSQTTHVGLIYALCPLVVLVLATAIGQEVLDNGRLVGVLASVAGSVVIALGNIWEPASAGRAIFWGDLLLLGAVCSWGGYLTVNKPLVARHGALPVLAGTFLMGAVLQAPIALVTAGSWRPLSTVSSAAWLALAYMALLVTVVALACQNYALKRFDASYVATVGNAAPVLTVIWGVWLLGERASWWLVIGGALIMGGIVWAGKGRVSSHRRVAGAESGDGAAIDEPAAVEPLVLPVGGMMPEGQSSARGEGVAAVTSVS